MRLYNTLSRTIEEFKPINAPNVKIYTCGPTVYDRAHIGNFTSYIYWDLLIRTLQLSGYQPQRILNLTDVGHLASDADDGIDKLEKGAKREQKTVWEIADFYSNYFLNNFHKLELIKPTKICRATDYIKQDLELVDLLTKKGYTYETSDGIYFDTSKFQSYPDFAGLDLKNLKAGARVDFNAEKRNVSDFAVWKFVRQGEDHAMQWQYLGRNGYPGWHLECATIIHTELGETIDIHTGGIDHIPIHHTNEIAESECAFDKKLCNFWLHSNFITVDGTKISKSLDNTYTIEQLEEQGYHPLDFKLWVLQGHYQGTRNFSFTDLAGAKSRRLAWRNRAALAFQKSELAPTGIFDQILAATQDNLNSPLAFSIIDTNDLSYGDWKLVDRLLGLQLTHDIEQIPTKIQSLLEARNIARQNKDYSTADSIRDELATYNFTALDTKTGVFWQFLA